MTVRKLVHRTSLPTLNLGLHCKWCLKSHTSNWFCFPRVDGLCPNMDDDQGAWNHWLWGRQRWRGGSEKGELNDKDKGRIDSTCISLCALHQGIAGACSCQRQTASFSLNSCLQRQRGRGAEKDSVAVCEIAFGLSNKNLFFKGCIQICFHLCMSMIKIHFSNFMRSKSKPFWFFDWMHATPCSVKNISFRVRLLVLNAPPYIRAFYWG